VGSGLPGPNIGLFLPSSPWRSVQPVSVTYNIPLYNKRNCNSSLRLHALAVPFGPCGLPTSLGWLTALRGTLQMAWDTCTGPCLHLARAKLMSGLADVSCILRTIRRFVGYRMVG
jgi:hypothetical protein